jgi:hypothetical protein
LLSEDEIFERWVTEAKQALGVTENYDLDRLLKVARVVAHQADRRGAPVTTFLMGIAAGRAGGAPDRVDVLCDEITELARSFDAATS